MPTGYTKTSSTGTDQCIILDPRQAFIRETTLPANWQRVRIGAFISLTGASGENTDPVAEAIVRASFRDDFYFGLSDGAGHPGDGSTRFIGLCMKYQSGFANLEVANNSGWNPLYGGGGNNVLAAVVWNGTSHAKCAFDGPNYAYNFAAGYSPAASTSFACWLGFDLSLVYGASPAINYDGFWSDVPRSLDTDVSNGAMLTGLATAKGMTNRISSTAYPAWWTSKATSPVDCRHLYLRFPYRNNRLRIHAIGAMQLA